MLTAYGSQMGELSRHMNWLVNMILTKEVLSKMIDMSR